MAISLSDLPTTYQEQAFKKWMDAQDRKTKKALRTVYGEQKETKYHNKPTERITAAGNVLKFGSIKEADRYDELILMQQANEIYDLRMQVDFTLQEAYTDTEGERIYAIRYKADFTYYKNGKLIVEDVKSKPTRTKIYIMKRKMMKERFNIDITEV